MILPSTNAPESKERINENKNIENIIFYYLHQKAFLEQKNQVEKEKEMESEIRKRFASPEEDSNLKKALMILEKENKKREQERNDRELTQWKEEMKQWKENTDESTRIERLISHLKSFTLWSVSETKRTTLSLDDLLADM
jgi:hypothetical protein